jgi:nitrite reductase/ring-hydroxylating ferredoxin subunit
MLTAKENQLISDTNPGTPAGKYLRSFWQPIAVPAQLERRNPMPVEVMGEKLVLFRAGDGSLGLLDDRCAHRGTSLSTGSVEIKTAGRIDRRGIRCCYHGWLYGLDGQCLDQPGEPAGSRFFEKIRIKAYPVEERYGFIWGYLGVGEPPAIPPLDALARVDGYRLNTVGTWPCNYFQVCENLVDPVHATVLHVETAFDKPFEAVPTVRAEPTPFGLKTIAGRPGYEREVEYLMPTGVRLALPIMKPAIMMAFWVVPIDNGRSQSFHSWFLPLSDELSNAERDQKIQKMKDFIYELDHRDPVYHSSKVNAQDKFACASQGVLADRSGEHLGGSDVGVILMRKLFRQGISDVEANKLPRGVLKEKPSAIIDFPNVN